MNDDHAEPLLYRQLMAIKPSGMSANQWLVDSGVNRSFFSDLRKRGRARSDIIDKLVETAGLTSAQFYAMGAPDPSPEVRKDEVQSRQLPFRHEEEPRDVPIVGTAMGADFEISVDNTMIFSELTELSMHEVHDYARRPRALANRRDVYVLMTVGDSMAPKHGPGDPVYVDPKATPRIGDDVVVYLRRGEDDGDRVYSVLLKELVKASSSLIELRQHRPDVSFTIPRSEIAQIHRIIPWRELTLF